MKANETKVDKFLASNETTFAIPVYQRNYDWTLLQCKQLLQDIIEAGKNDKITAHFIGSIVYVHDDVYTASGLTELNIIDGQQRLTTITLIYIALYRLARDLGNEMLVSRIQKTYLINEFASEEEKLKLKPTENNKAALRHILYATDGEEFKGYSKIIENFDYFKSAITRENFDIIQRGLSKLIFVDIALDRQKDNPQRIFESLNSTGLELSQADLIRNYILMGLNSKAQNNIYKNYWEVIENFAKDENRNDSRVSDYIRDYLTLENKKIPNKGKVYLEFKAKYPISSIEKLESNLLAMRRLVKYYNKLINPKNETDKAIRWQLEYLQRLEINVALPFLMKVYDDYDSSIIDKPTFLKVIDLIQSFSWRRFIVGLPTNALNQIFMGLYDKVEQANYLYSIQNALLQRSGAQRFPQDEEVIAALKVKDVYNIKSKNRIYLLERIENFQNTERVVIDDNPNITIEHIFPQHPDPKWKTELGHDEYNLIKEKYLNTIGNLTLSGNNAQLANKPFKEKRDLAGAGYKDSRLWMNKYLATLDKWDKTAIEARFAMIAERFLKIWEYPPIKLTNNGDNQELNIFEADEPTHKKLAYAIFFDQKLEVNQVSKLYIEVFKQLFALQPETFFTSDLGERIGLTKNPAAKGLRKAVSINDTYFIESNIDNTGKFERIKQALTLFNLEDELFIKYAESAE